MSCNNEIQRQMNEDIDELLVALSTALDHMSVKTSHDIFETYRRIPWIASIVRTPGLIHEDATGSYHSDYVLVIADGRKTVAAYAVDDYGPKWIEGGRDGYHLDNVTAWMPLP